MRSSGTTRLKELRIRLEEGQDLLAPPCSINKGGEKMRFAICAGWDYSSIIAVLKLDGSLAVEGKDYRLYKDGNWDDAETGVILSEGIVLHRFTSLFY